MIQNIGIAQGAARHGEIREGQKNRANLSASREGGADRIEKIKAMIENGEYQINLRAVAEKMAEQLQPGS